MPKSKYSAGLEGLRFNRAVVVSFSHFVKTKEEVRWYWNCACDCGYQFVADARGLFRGSTQSCGCLGRERLNLRAKHGHTSTKWQSREYTSWKKLKARVDNPKNEWFHRYGGRGIRYCAGFNDFSHFLKVVGPRPWGRSIDRINNDGHYSCGCCSECTEKGWPMNCRWATPKEQSVNRSPRTAKDSSPVRQEPQNRG